MMAFVGLCEPQRALQHQVHCQDVAIVKNEVEFLAFLSDRGKSRSDQGALQFFFRSIEFLLVDGMYFFDPLSDQSF